MRKIRKTMETKNPRYNVDAEPGDVRREGTIITFWPSVIGADLITLLGKARIEASITDSVTHQESIKTESDRHKGAMALSDGTQVIFATVGRPRIVQGIDRA